MEDGGWVSNDWQPQVIAKFGEYDVKDLLHPPADADMLRAGGHIRGGYTPPSERAMQTYAMGGDVSNSSLGGVEVESGGYLEPISYNPYNDGTGVTSIIRGQSHDEYNSKLGHSGVMLNAYGNQVEAERGEPIREMEEGGLVGNDKSAVITGNLIYKKLDDITDSKYDKYSGKKIKNIHKEFALKDQKLNKKQEKNTDEILNLNPNTAIEKLTLGTLEANELGFKMQYAKNSEAADYFTNHQSIINGVADDYGLVADNLSKYEVKKAKMGISLPKAQEGYTSKYDLKPWEGNKNKLGAKTKSIFNTQQWDKIAENLGFKGKGNKEFQKFLLEDPNRAKLIKSKNKELYGTEDVKIDDMLGAAYNVKDFLYQANPLDYGTPLKPGSLPSNDNYAKLTKRTQDEQLKTLLANMKGLKEKEALKSSWLEQGMSAFNQALPFFRPSDQEELDPRQLSGEFYALSNNQVEPVQAQTYQPQLQTPVDISYQDQINEITAQTRQAEKLAGNNPEALAAIYAQATMAKNRVLGEQMRVNQGTKAQTYAGNIDTLNNAQLMNLKAYDAQQLKQETAKSLTKATTQEALNSIASKYAQNKAANRQLAIMENLYNYRYDKSGRAINMNPLVNFDEMIANASPDELTKYKALLEAKTSKEKTSTKASRNGSIVKAIKNL
jgi:hypothetical protein